MKYLILGLGVLVLAGCSKNSSEAELHASVQEVSVSSNTKSLTPAEDKQPEKELTQEEKDRTFVNQVAEALTLEEAIKLASSQLGNQYQKDEKISLGANGLVWWSEKNLDWNLLNRLSSTTYSEFRKDPFLETGKKICANVSVSEIEAIRNKDSVQYFATLKDRKKKDQIYQAILYNSTKGINENSKVRVCGIALENFQYKNIANKYTNSIFMVGLLDLPENR